MKHYQLFVDSLIHPKKLAAYRMLSIGKVIQYAFLLITTITAFSYGQFLTSLEAELSSATDFIVYFEKMKGIVYPFAFLLLFIFMTLIHFAKISLYALGAMFFAKAMQKRGEYRQIWRTASFAITWSVILSIVFTIFGITTTISTIIGIIITLIFLMIALLKYPQAN